MTVPNGKIALTAQAMKGAAHEIARGQVLQLPHEIIGFNAAAAALRQDAIFTFPGCRAPSQARLTMFFGEIGAGGREILHSWSREAIRCGHRTILMTARGVGYVARISETDALRIDLRDVEAGAVALPEAARRSAMSLHLACRTPAKDPVNQIDEILLALADFDPEIPTQLLIDDYFDSSHEILTEILAARPLWSAITQSCYRNMLLPGSLKAADQILQGRWHQHAAFAQLTEGQYRLLDADLQPGPVFVAPYDGFIHEPPSLHKPGVHQLSSNIARALKTYPGDTHVGRLQIVARAAGFRNWQAAEGRASVFTDEWTGNPEPSVIRRFAKKIMKTALRKKDKLAPSGDRQ